MNHYCVLTRDLQGVAFFRELNATQCEKEIHINRTRFWLDPSLPNHAQFYLKWSHVIHAVDPRENLSSGLIDV
jgi:hypothetical protein